MKFIYINHMIINTDILVKIQNMNDRILLHQNYVCNHLYIILNLNNHLKSIHNQLFFCLNINNNQLNMVRGYDPSKNDYVKYIMDSILNRMHMQKRLTPQQSETLVKKWYSHQKYNKIFQEFKKEGIQSPKILLRNKCNTRNQFIFIKKSNSYLKYYPAQWEQQNNRIVLCLNYIHNKIELKQNIDRELNIAYLAKVKKINFEEDESRMQALYKSCQKQYQNIHSNEEIINNCSKKCAKYLFFRRFSEYNKYPLDAQFRYTTILADENCL